MKTYAKSWRRIYWDMCDDDPVVKRDLDCVTCDPALG